MQGGYTTHQVGANETEGYRLFFLHNGTPISPFHDIPLWADKAGHIANMVVEIPRGTHAKLEISRPLPLNPIKQDIKNGKLRYIHDAYPFNYGAFPQTWEDPSFITPETNAKGDMDPLDVCEVGVGQGHTGQIKQVKILGVWAMVDEGETDWKVLVIDVNDPKAKEINNADDLEKAYPGTIKKTFEFLRDYKIPAGAGPNHFAFEGALKDKAYALKVTEETYHLWHKLITGATTNKTEKYHIELQNLTQEKFRITADEAKVHAKL